MGKSSFHLLAGKCKLKMLMRYGLTSLRYGLHEKVRNNMYWERCREKKEPHSFWECKAFEPLWKTAWWFCEILKNSQPYEPTILPLGIYSNNTKTFIWKDICTPMFIVAFFRVAKIVKWPQCPSTDEWLKMAQMLSVMNMWHVNFCSNIDGTKMKC